jgi:hypothetical protein
MLLIVKTILTKIIYLLLAGYLLFCITIYFMQNSMLFPAHLASPVSDAWQPTTGVSHQQVLLDGHCGKLHAAIWRVVDEKGIVMVFHGNGESVASVEHQVPMFHQLGYSVMTWDYPGYGQSTSCWFSESDLLDDADNAFKWLSKQSSTLPIILYGRSVGSGLALYVASKHPQHRVLLISPYDALANVAKDHMPFFIPVDLLIRVPLHAEKWINHVQGSVHAIHGLADTLIMPERAMALMQKANGNADIEWVIGAGHNDIQMFEQYRLWLKKYLLAS